MHFVIAYFVQITYINNLILTTIWPGSCYIIFILQIRQKEVKTGKESAHNYIPVALQSMGSQRVRHNWATKLNELKVVLKTNSSLPRGGT